MNKQNTSLLSKIIPVFYKDGKLREHFVMFVNEFEILLLERTKACTTTKHWKLSNAFSDKIKLYNWTENIKEEAKNLKDVSSRMFCLIKTGINQL